jgi:hypothetical protein
MGHLATMTEAKAQEVPAVRARALRNRNTILRARDSEVTRWCGLFRHGKEIPTACPAEDRADHSDATAATCQKTFQGSPPVERGGAWIGIVRGGGAGTNPACREPGHAFDDAVNLSNVSFVILDVVVAEDRRPITSRGGARNLEKREGP